jgi:hypothetical protein
VRPYEAPSQPAVALACGRDLEDADRIAAVEKAAIEQLAWIDAHDPGYDHSTPSARSRGQHDSIFAMLAHQAHARWRMLQRGH